MTTVSSYRRTLLRRLAWVEDRIRLRDRSEAQLSYYEQEAEALHHVLAGGSIDPNGRRRAKIARALVNMVNVLGPRASANVEHSALSSARAALRHEDADDEVEMMEATS